ncbi:MAG: ABC transporter substrate-binding protein, partial [Leptolyngbyaceae cyanobacterium RM2_2_4]|nr:ABC transporter substrate-binding protein [Leptolyngbyaceae cyanobacterium RM2_2_4]
KCQPNIERILLLKPDLILGASACSQNYSLLLKIAPTILSDLYVNTNWRENFNFTSHILGRESSAQAVWTHYYERIEKIRSVLATKQQDMEVAVVDIFGSQLYPYTKSLEMFTDIVRSGFRWGR